MSAATFPGLQVGFPFPFSFDFFLYTYPRPYTHTQRASEHGHVHPPCTQARVHPQHPNKFFFFLFFFFFTLIRVRTQGICTSTRQRPPICVHMLCPPPSICKLFFLFSFASTNLRLHATHPHARMHPSHIKVSVFFPLFLFSLR